MRAVIEKIIADDNVAILFIGDEEKPTLVPMSQLPDESREGDWVVLEMIDGQVMNIVFDDQETHNRRTQIEKKLELLKKNSSSRFKIK